MITIILLVLLLIDIIVVGQGAFAVSAFLTGLTLAGIWIFSHNPFLVFIENPAATLYGAVGYFVLGFVYSLLKYKKVLIKEKAKINNWEQVKWQFAPSKLSGDIFGWIFWWPLCIVGYIFSDLVKDVCDKVWLKIKSFFESIYNKA